MSGPQFETLGESPSVLRNREPILGVLRTRLPERGLVLEVASGDGGHAAFFCHALPGLRWQPTEADPAALPSIERRRRETGLANLLPPVLLDAGSAAWPVERADAVVAINLLHISPWASAEGLLAGAARVLDRDGLLCVYGPFFEADRPRGAGNVAFDANLRSHDPAWGVRELDDVEAAAGRHGLRLAERIDMPADNRIVIFRRPG
ncbi:DUF938 domain-containing protein [Marinivivus vitaminiproducens]|uniref:DUF938 domain-containing protein n=1 Tax=Marinivivus vitaminiproducens TaxID=3035935 RepID=UPI00279B9689|nr:DUF938 domain-containing protein [Geminicoccaceae bacterium SCSIO 64248]